MDFKNIFYKRECCGEIQKEGQTFKKYKRVPRFPFLKRGKKNISALILIVVMLFIAAIIILKNPSLLKTTDRDKSGDLGGDIYVPE